MNLIIYCAKRKQNNINAGKLFNVSKFKPSDFSTSGISSQPNMHTRLHRTTSIVHSTPLPLRVQNPEKTVTDWLQMHSSVTGGPGGLAIGRGRSPSFTEHAPLSPQSSVTSSGSGGSDSHHDDGPQPVRDSFLEEGSGMRGQLSYFFFLKYILTTFVNSVSMCFLLFFFLCSDS